MKPENNPFQKISAQLQAFEQEIRVQDILKEATIKLRHIKSELSMPYCDEEAISSHEISHKIQKIIDMLTDDSTPYTQEIRVQQRTIELLERMANIVESIGVIRNPYVAEIRSIVETWRAGPFTEFKGEAGCHES